MKCVQRVPASQNAAGSSDKARVRSGASHFRYGYSMLEVMASLLVLVIGMMAVFKVATVASAVNTKTRQMYVALSKTQTILEALKGTSMQTLVCLAGGSQPSACLTTCVSSGGDDYHCRLALGLLPGQTTDRHGTSYTFIYSVQPSTTYTNVFDIQLSTRWMGEEEPPRYHYITLKTKEYRQ